MKHYNALTFLASADESNWPVLFLNLGFPPTLQQAVYSMCICQGMMWLSVHLFDISVGMSVRQPAFVCLMVTDYIICLSVPFSSPLVSD